MLLLIISQKSHMMLNFYLYEFWLLILLAFCLISCDGNKDDSDLSNPLFKLNENQVSMSIRELNKNVSEAKIVILVDVNADVNRGVVIHRGKTVDHFNVYTGFEFDNSDNYVHDINSANSRTYLGSYSIHMIDYCPPWLSYGGADSCADNNPLGRYSFWFRSGNESEFEYGVHTRHNSLDIQRQFKALKASQRRRSRGCIVLPHDNIVKLFDLIGEEVNNAFINLNAGNNSKNESHPAIKKIQEVRNSSNKTEVRNQNIVVKIRDINNDFVRTNFDGFEIPPMVPLDVRVVTINSSDKEFVSPFKDLVELKKFTPQYNFSTIV